MNLDVFRFNIIDIFDKIDDMNLYTVPPSDTDNTINSTYGEIALLGIQKIINNISIDKNDVFYDLGSGRGRVPMLLYCNTHLKKAVGIEYHVHRHDIAQLAIKLLYRTYPTLLHDKRILSYYHGNIMHSIIDDATIVFLCSTCFTEELMNSLFTQLQKCPKLRYIITLKPYDKFKELLPYVKEIKVKCSWSNEVTCSIYYKNN